jgi:hypothetical protein
MQVYSYLDAGDGDSDGESFHELCNLGINCASVK